LNIVCENCKTVYRFDAAKIPPGGKKVKCSNCQHVFRAMPNTGNDGPSTLDGDGDVTGEATGEKAARERRGTKASGKGEAPKKRRLLLRQDGTRYAVSDLANLQRWIVERRVTREAELSEDGEVWEKVGERMDLLPFFSIVDRSRAKKRARRRALGLPDEPEGGHGGIGHDEVMTQGVRDTSVPVAVTDGSESPDGTEDNSEEETRAKPASSVFGGVDMGRAELPVALRSIGDDDGSADDGSGDDAPGEAVAGDVEAPLGASSALTRAKPQTSKPTPKAEANLRAPETSKEKRSGIGVVFFIIIVIVGGALAYRMMRKTPVVTAPVTSISGTGAGNGAVSHTVVTGGTGQKGSHSVSDASKSGGRKGTTPGQGDGSTQGQKTGTSAATSGKSGTDPSTRKSGAATVADHRKSDATVSGSTGSKKGAGGPSSATVGKQAASGKVAPSAAIGTSTDRKTSTSSPFVAPKTTARPTKTNSKAPETTSKSAATAKKPTKAKTSRSRVSSPGGRAGKYIATGRRLLRQGRYKEAVDYFRKATVASPKSAFCYKELVWGLLNLADASYTDTEKHWTEAIAAGEKAIQLNSRYAEAYHLKGVAHMYMKQNDAAIQAFKSALTYGLRGDDATEAKAFIRRLEGSEG